MKTNGNNQSAIVKLLLVLAVFLFAFGTKQVARAADPATDLVNPKLLATYGDIEVWGEESYDFILPFDGVMVINLKLVNTSNGYRYFSFNQLNDAVPNDSNAKKLAGYIQPPCTHPSPNWFCFQPKEERMMQIAYYSQNLRNIKETVKKASFTSNITFVSKDLDSSYREMGDGKEYKFNLDFTITAYAYNTVLKGKKMTTATVKGKVTDANGKPVQYAAVRIRNGIIEYSGIMTDAKGNYSVKVTPYYSKYRQMWNRYTIEVTSDKYATTRAIITPKKNKTVTKNITLKKATAKQTYKQTKKVDLNIQAYDLDASADGSVIATVPFHTLLPESELKGKTKMVVTSNTGKIYFEKELPSETPMVDVSDDGKYILVTAEFEGTWESLGIIYDINGNEVYRTPNRPKILNKFTGEEDQERNQRCYCAVLSHDNKYLVLGSGDGDLWVYDWKEDKLIFTANPQGQVRTADFSEDNKLLYITSGSGYVYCYNIETGELVWRNFIIAWGTQSILTSKYLIVTTKSDGYSLFVLDNKTGKLVWDYPTVTRGCALAVSPDEKYVFFGTDNGGEFTSLNAVLFELDTGKIKQAYTVLGGDTAQGAVFNEKGTQILIKSSKGFGIYNVKTGTPLYEKEVVKGNGDNAYSLAFSLYASPDFKYVVAGFNNDSSFRYWGQLYFFKKTN